MNQFLSQERDVALAAVRAAAAAIGWVERVWLAGDALAKRDRSPVTVADFASQAVIAAHLERAFPHDAILAEESADELRRPEQAALLARVVEAVRAAAIVPGGLLQPETVTPARVLAWIDRGAAAPPGPSPARFWTIDPIDGTKGFLRRQQYAIALALVRDGAPALGVLGCPNLAPHPGQAPAAHAAPAAGDPAAAHAGCLFVAVGGGGAWEMPLRGPADQAGVRVRVASAGDPAGLRFCESCEGGHSDQVLAARVAARLGMGLPPLRLDSQVKYAAVARGQAAVYLRLPVSEGYRENVWDHAAGQIVVREAGGRVTDLAGRDLDFTRGRRLEANRGVVASGAGLHERVLAAVAEAQGSPKQP